MRRKRKAFTLMEIILVVAMLGLLMSLVIGNLDGIFGQSEKKVAAMFVNGNGKLPLTSYKLDMGRYPTTEEGLQALVSNPNDSSRWAGPYLDPAKIPLDPWGNAYQYSYPGEQNKNSYDYWSMGPDGATGTSDDIGNWVSDSE